MIEDFETPEAKPSGGRAFWRMTVWAAAAAFAAAISIWVSTSPPGVERLHSAMLAVPGTVASAPVPTVVAQIAPKTPDVKNFDAEGETRRLAQLVQLLAADRDRLATRIQSLERNVDDMTGSIKRGVERTDKPATITSAPPGVSAPATIAATASAPPPPANDNTPSPNSPPPTRAASLSPPVEASPAPSPSEYGIELGSALTVDQLRLLWLQTKLGHAPLLDSLQPAIALRTGAKTGTPQLRLIAGPFADAASAARVCAAFATGRGTCKPTAYDGQKLSVAAPAAPPAPARR